MSFFKRFFFLQDDLPPQSNIYVLFSCIMQCIQLLGLSCFCDILTLSASGLTSGHETLKLNWNKNIGNQLDIGFTKSAGSPASVTIVGPPFPLFTWCTSFFPWLWFVNKKLSARKARLAVRNWTSFGIWTWSLDWAKLLWYFDHNMVKMIRNAEGKSQRIEVFWKEMMVLQCCSLGASFTFLKMRISTMPLTMKNPHIVICWACRRKVYSAHQPVKNCCQWEISSNRVFLELI